MELHDTHAQEKPLERRPVCILHLEDNPNDSELVRAALESDGLSCEFEIATTHEQFTTLIERREIDLILSEFNVPGFDGLAALKMTREMLPDVPFILVSGTIGEEAAIDVLRAGATDYIIKHRLQRLAPAVRRALGETEERRKRKRSDEALRKNQERLEIIQRATNDVVWDWDFVTNSVEWSENVQTLFGYEPGQLGSDRDSWSSRMHPEDRDGILVSVQELIGSGGRVWSGEYRFLRADGSYAYVFDRGFVIRDERGKPVRVIGAMMDISKRRELEDQFRGAQKMEAIGRLAGGVAHDFNNLLTVINGYSKILLTRLEAGWPYRQELEAIGKAGERAASLTRQLLAFSRKQILEPKVLDLNSVVSEIDKLLRRLIGEDIELVTQLDKNLGRIKIDRTQLEQVIMNLAVNARDAMPQGGKLTIVTRNSKLDEAFTRQHLGARPGSYVLLAVSDTGCGMDEKTQSRLFEPFFTTKDQSHGTGLGLAMVYGIVKQSGGGIWVHSRPGQGSSFEIYLPRSEGEPLSARSEAEVVATPKGDETILVVDDDAEIRGFIVSVLKRDGYRVLSASDSEEARALCQTHQGGIDLLLSDVVMPRLSGPSLVRILKPLRPEMRVLYMSGYTDEAVTKQGVLNEDTPLLQKPFTHDSLIREIRKVLDAAEPKNPGSNRLGSSG